VEPLSGVDVDVVVEDGVPVRKFRHLQLRVLDLRRMVLNTVLHRNILENVRLGLKFRPGPNVIKLFKDVIYEFS
jgi:hypothetical protein